MGRINLYEPIKANLQLGGTTVAGLLDTRKNETRSFSWRWKTGSLSSALTSADRAIAGIQQAILSCCLVRP